MKTLKILNTRLHLESELSIVYNFESFKMSMKQLMEFVNLTCEEVFFRSFDKVSSHFCLGFLTFKVAKTADCRFAHK